MTYKTKDRSVQDGQPVEFYKFSGMFGAFRYTTEPEPAICAGEVYYPIEGGISRSHIEIGPVVSSPISMDFTLPANSEVAKLYCFKTSPEELKVEVFRAHRGDDWNTDYEVEWIGHGLDTTVSGRSAVIRTGSLLQTKLQGNVASVYYQRMCNHILFDERCKVDRAAWTYSATVTKVQNQLITVDDDLANNDDLKAGEIVVARTGEKRGIHSNTNNIIAISYPFIDIEVGDTVEITFGCDHKRTGHCKQRFNNVANYGGFDFIPLVNPFQDLHFDAYVTEHVKTEKAKRIHIPAYISETT